MEQPLRLSVERLGDGFFVPDEATQASGTAPGFRFVKVEGLAQPLQFCRVRVSRENAGEPPAELLVIGAHALTLRGRALEELRTKLEPFGAPCFWTASEDGFARRGAARGVPREWTAAALAVVKYYAAWDDSDPLRVDVEGIKFAVSTSHTAGRFDVSVTLIG